MYIVWTHIDYEGWTKAGCEDLKEATIAVLEGYKAGKEVILTQVVEFDVGIKFKEAKKVEVVKSETKPGKSTKTKSKSTVRSGSTPAVPKLD